MGVVHRAVDLAHGPRDGRAEGARRAASEPDAEMVTRFLLEAEILEQLDHAAIVRHVAHGSLEDGAPYLVMEWIDGPTLEGRLEGRPLRVQDALLLTRRLAEALSVAHAAGVVTAT
ncbi:MAG: protein kinase [Myxococcales bacterium]|nr:protein kinase [Myxococcales bacterium]